MAGVVALGTACRLDGWGVLSGTVVETCLVQLVQVETGHEATGMDQ